MTSHVAAKSELELVADVVVLGGGPSGAWAALTAAARGAHVVLAEKGFLGSSGATAPSNTGVWYAPNHAASRDRIVKRYWDAAAGLADRSWIDRVLEITYERINQLEAWGYRFPLDAQGIPYRAMLRGPDYMRFLRKMVTRAGVTILDQSPALELLGCEGSVAGAAGVNRQTGVRWSVRSGAVVVATGGCAFLSNSLGCNTQTGDGYLMAAEAGAVLSGMEFSSQYGLCPSDTSMNKAMPFNWASYSSEDGVRINVDGDPQIMVARAMLEGRQIYAVFDRASLATQLAMRKGQPNVFLPHDRLAIDPFIQRFPVTLRFEGTVRGVGGIDVDATCATATPGLFAAGDAATREHVAGASTGGGSANAAWAISSGSLAGEAAARFSSGLGAASASRPARPLGRAGLRSDGRRAIVTQDVIRELKSDIVSLERNFFRSQSSVMWALARLNQLWADCANGLELNDTRNIRPRETASMIATARWMYASALARSESRGMHRRTDFSKTDPAQRRRILTHGVDEIITFPQQSLREVAS